MNTNTLPTPSTPAHRLTPAQAEILSALASLALLALYVVWPDGRGATLQLLCLIPLLGMFLLSPHDLLITGGLSLGLLLIVLLALWVVPPLGMLSWDPMHDGMPALMASLILPLITTFAYRHAQRREQVAEQRLALQEAHDKMKIMAAKDPLTGLANQQQMSLALNQEFKRAQRASTPMSLAWLDLDHLGAYNDQHGHEAGDQLLCRFAQQLQDAFRENEVVARWSGAAFMVIFTDSHLEQATAGLERLRETVAEQQLGLSFSAALVTRRDGDRLDDLIGRAQTSLQRAKAQGRDRVICTP